MKRKLYTNVGKKIKRIISAKKAAKLLNLKLNVLQVYLSQGRLDFTFIKIKQYRYFIREEIINYVNAKKAQNEKVN